MATASTSQLKLMRQPKFAVGAAARSGVLIGANIKARLFDLTISAARITMAGGVIEGDRESVAVTSDSGGPIVQCGAPQQFLAEPNSDLIIVGATVRGDRNIGNLLRLDTKGILKNADVS